MHSWVVRAGVLLAAIGLGASMTSCFSEKSSAIFNPADGDCRIPLDSPVFGSAGVVVAMRDFAFRPAELRVPRGTRVTWVYCEPPNIDPHTTTSDTGVWGSDFLSSGTAIFSRVFDQPGRFEYHCIPHPSFMRGVVIVE
jgi:plastocyanin